MRLKKLILHGFKSFADRTEFTFENPITGIVGPNGCGKSNVVDGFKWVLGEQSAKSLRGEAMMDVIFNGSSARKAAGMAEVTLVFDNPKRADSTRMLNIDTDEVAVGRRLFRDGTSEYQVNNQSARLKDVRELFFDTGVGVDAYSVIEQGRVAMLLESNPQERRLIFEEAAGISKFKAKKKESQRKLERVDQNLLRVTDIVDEVEKRLRSVRIQAGRARTYQEHSQRLKELRLTYALQEYYTLQTQLDENVSAEGKCKAELEQIDTELSEKQLALQQSRQQYENLTGRKQKAEFELVQSRAGLQACQQRQHYAQQQLQQIAEQLKQFQHDREAVSARAMEVGNALTAEEQSLARLTDEVSEHRRQIEARQQAFRDTQLQLNQINNDIEQHKTAILDLMRRSAAVNSRIGAIEIERKNITAQQQRLAQRRQIVVTELETLEAGRRELDAQLAAVTQQIGKLQGELDQSARDAAALGRQIAQITEHLGAAREHRSGLISRQRLLEDLEARREGMSEGVKSVLKQREKFPFIRGVVADVLRVDVEHAPAIEAALDGRDQWLIADNSAAAIRATEDLADLEGRVNVLCADELESDPTAGFPQLGESRLCFATPQSQNAPAQNTSAETGVPALQLPLHFGDPEVPSVLSTQYLVLPLNPAPRTLDPDYYNWNLHAIRIRLAIDLVRFQPADAAIARHLLGRTIVVDTLEEARTLQSAAPRCFRYVTRDGQVLESDGTLRVGPLAASMSLISRRSELEALTQQIADVDRRIEELSQQLSTGNQQAKALQARQNEVRSALYHANTRKVETNSRIAQNTDKQSAFRRELPVLERELQNFLDQFGRLKIEEAGLQEKRQQIESEQSSRQRQVEQLTQKQTEGAEQLKQCGEALTSLRVELGQVQEKQIASQQAVERLTGEKAGLAEQIKRIESSAQQVTLRRGAVEHELHQALALEKELDNRQNKLAKHIEIINADIAKVQTSLQELAWQVEQVKGRHDELSQSLHQFQMKIGEIRVRLETLIQRTNEEVQLDLPARWAELQQNGGYQPSETNWDAVAEEIRQLKDKLHRLGNVNLDAIGEQDELEQREQFLSTQVKDLTESKRQLEELIDTINNESADRFEKCFAAVREHFQAMFRKLFGGGKADIFLETEIEQPRSAPPANAEATPADAADPTAAAPQPRKIDILDAGIEIIAKPPGKQPVNISQLSGGEKTMTCIALLMSIFKSKPSPFCLLDEVDAALDEANNKRFNLIVQEFLEQSQFIVITHSKSTMQIADVLYGVTMQEQGVSRKVAVKFDQVDAQGRVSETAAA